MRQIFRFFVQPQTFFNQLQWSRAHWFILAAFGAVAFFETRTSMDTEVYLILSEFLGSQGLTLNQSLWLITASKLAILYGGIYLMTSVVYWVGNIIGERKSRRVLFRRITVVFTVLLLAKVFQQLGEDSTALWLTGALLYVWCALLGFYAIREQFSLSRVETIVVTLLAGLILSTTLHFSKHVMHTVADASLELAAPALSDRDGHANERLHWED